MPRQYKVTFEDVAVSAAQDLIEVLGAAGKIVRIIRATVGATDTSLPTAQMIKTRCRFLPSVVTSGTGGTTPTPQKIDPGDAAASFTAYANNTAKATTSGTAVVLAERGDHLYSGAEFNFPERPVVGPSEAFVFELLSTVSGTVHMSGDILCEEIGG